VEPFSVVLEDVGKSFGATSVFKHVSLEAKWGEAVAVLGPSGAGKTTLLRIVGTLDNPTEGSVEVGGVYINKLGRSELAELRWSCLGFSFQEPLLLPDITALENVLLPCIPRMNSSKLKEFRQKALKLLEILGLSDRAFFKPHQLSVGQKKRVDLARALINDPKILIVDEPTTNLDVESAQIIEGILRKQIENGFTLFLTTHRDQNLLSMASTKIELTKYKGD